MDSFEIVIGIVVLAVVVFQAWLTVQVHRSGLYDRRQKILQTQLIWLLPLLGSSLVYTMLRDEGSDGRRGHSQNGSDVQR